MRLSSRVAKINPSETLAITAKANPAGAAFGVDNHISLSYATSLANIEEGIKRIKNAISKLVS